MKKIFFTLALALLPFGTFAEGDGKAFNGCPDGEGKCFNLTESFFGEKSELKSESQKSLTTIVKNFVSLFTYLIGALAVLGVLIGGFFMIFAAEDEDLNKKAKNSVVYSVIGLVLSLTSYLLIQLVQTLIYSFGN